jgi:hypothetical protein
MLYNKQNFPKVASTAGKITIITALAGVVVFATVLLIDFGAKEISRVSAQTATTTLTVLNTPPVFTVYPAESPASATTTPTNSGSAVTWQATAVDANGASWFLLICGDSNATPTANANARPRCNSGITQWAVSATTTSGSQATAATTTQQWGVGEFAEVNSWFAWACDADAIDPRCTTVAWSGYGDGAATSSPFQVNNRPTFTIFDNDGPVDPGGTINFQSTSTDPDTVGGEDAIYLVVCGSNSYNSTTNTCSSNFIASTTLTLLSDAYATYSIPPVIRDQSYAAYGFIVDQHGHEASGGSQGTNVPFVVNNVAPTILGGDIILNGASALNPSVPEGETTGFTLSFTARDANSCVTSASTSEITNYYISVFRSGIGTSSCNSIGQDYDPNNCYTNGVSTGLWNLNCVASSTSCVSPVDDTQVFNCTFPLWFVADPTDVGPYAAQNWSAAVAVADDDFATSSFATTTNPKELIAFTAIDLITAQIPYGSLEPGDNTGTLNASTTVESVGNTSLDQNVTGDSMCGTYTPSSPCEGSATSTIPEFEQQFASTSLAYNSPLALDLSSTTQQEVELDVPKTTSTSSPNTGTTWWGIAVPVSITLAGSYEGMNTFYAQTDELYQ